MTLEEVARTIARHVAHELKDTLPQPARGRLLTPKEAARYLRISDAQLHRLKAESRIKFVQDRKNARVFYDIADLDRYIDGLKD